MDLEAYLAGEPISARSGRLTTVVSRALRETHHAAVLENWGLLWIWHSIVILLLCVLTNILQEQGSALAGTLRPHLDRRFQHLGRASSGGCDIAVVP